eukprot:scaffold11875_cov132-Isochrysis_galbana.AAC.6
MDLRARSKLSIIGRRDLISSILAFARLNVGHHMASVSHSGKHPHFLRARNPGAEGQNEGSGLWLAGGTRAVRAAVSW